MASADSAACELTRWHMPCAQFTLLMQTIRCQQLAGSEAALREWLDTFQPATASCSTHRCCAVLDGPLVPGEQQTMFAVLAPAGSGGGGGAVVRALALSSSTAVCPPGKHLLYLWTGDAAVSGSSNSGSGDGGESVESSAAPQADAASLLMPALAALADTSHLEAVIAGSGITRLGDEATAARDGEAVAAEAAGIASSSSSSGSSKPAVVWAAFYFQASRQLLLQPGGQQPESTSSGGRWPANVALCPGPDGTATFTTAVQAAKQCYWQLFPPATGAAVSDAVFPLDPQASQLQQQHEGEGEGEGGGAVAAADPDSDEEAVAALQAALRPLYCSRGSARNGAAPGE